MTDPEIGAVTEIAAGVRRIIAPNPGPMTYWGTNTFILGEGSVAIVDPGPKNETHLKTLLEATEGEDITHILVTHAHADHSPLARELSRATGAPILGFGPPDAGRSNTMKQLAESGLAGGGEGVDADFKPDVIIRDGALVEGKDWNIEVLHTPGHFAGHLGFRFDDFLLSGDHVMAWASSLVSPPDGDVGAFMATSERLWELGHLTFLPAHGPALENAAKRLEWLTDHRKSRETAILNTLGSAPLQLGQITSAVYTDIDPKMIPAAERNVFAHLIDLHERNLIEAEPELSTTAGFRRP